MAINAAKAKDINRSRVLNLIRKGSRLSRSEISEAVGLSAPAVGNLVSELIRDGLVREVGRRQKGRGQPAKELELRPEGGYALGLLLERNLVSGALVDLAGEVLAQERVSLDALPMPGEALARLRSLVASLVPRRGRSRFLGVGLATFGPLDLEAGTVNATQFSSDWDGIPLRDQLADATGLTVYLDNDATAAAIGEYWYGAGRTYPNFLYVYLSDGLGGGLFLDGRAYRGGSLNAGEFGHMLLNRPDGVGALEDVVSLQAFARRLGGESRRRPLDALEAGFERRDPELLACLDDAAGALAQAFVSVDHLLDLDAIILGGQPSKPLLEYLLDTTRERCEPFYLRGKPRRAALVLSQTGGDDAVLGAATLPLYDAFVVPARTEPGGQVFSSDNEEVV